MNIQLNDKWRVITCPANIQWILQFKRGGRWRDRSFVTTRDALIRLSKEHAGEISSEAWNKLQSLPHHFKMPVEALRGGQEAQVDNLDTYPPEELIEPLLPTNSAEGENA
jgi:hypothetical protein